MKRIVAIATLTLLVSISLAPTTSASPIGVCNSTSSPAHICIAYGSAIEERRVVALDGRDYWDALIGTCTIPLPTGGSTIIPAVWIAQNGGEATTCHPFTGGTFTAIAGLEQVAVPDATGSEGVFVGIYEADISSTVLGFGVTGVPAVAPGVTITAGIW